MRVLILLLFICSSLFAHAQSEKDFKIISDHFYQEIMSQVPADQVATWHVEDIKQWSKTIRENGSFPDFDYNSTTNSDWGPTYNMSIAVIMALATKTQGHPYYQSNDLKEKCFRVIHYITTREWDHVNWWHKEIGLPLNTYRLLFLIGDELPTGDREWLMNATRKGHILDHPSKWPAEGQNAVWYAEITLALGVLYKQAQWFKDVRDALAIELQLNNKQGMQVDGTFYQHGKVFMNGSYGLTFSLDMARFFYRLSGTSFAFSAEQYKNFAGYLLDAQLWLIHGKNMDPSSKGREYARKNNDNTNRLLLACVNMAKVAGPRQKEFEQCEAELTAQNYMGKNGNKLFYRADFMTYNRKTFVISVKMYSERTLNGDSSPLREGLKSHHQSDGVTYIFRDGSEYYNIAPVWDFNRQPGITIDYRKDYPTVPDFNYWPFRGLSDFVGGVTDGTDGAATMDFQYQLLEAKKSWFFHDKVMVGLGAGISGFIWQNTQTNINQEWSQGPILFGNDTLKDGRTEVTQGSWAYANGVGYHLINGKKFYLQNTTQTGTWKSVADQLSDELVKGKVTSLWIENGKGPGRDSYAYAVYPAMSLEDFKKEFQKPTFEILSNTAKVQAVKFNDDLYQVIFHEIGEVRLNKELSLKVDKPVAIMLRQKNKQLEVYVSAPDQKVATVNIAIREKSKEVHKKLTLPVEFLAGSSVKTTLSL